MLTNYPPRIRSMIGRIELILGNLSDIQLSISLDGNIGDLPEVQAVKRSLTSSHAEGLLLAIHQAFIAKDLARVNALSSYFLLFDLQTQDKCKGELIEEMKSYISGLKTDEQFAELFLHAGYISILNYLSDKELMDIQYKEFYNRFLVEESLSSAKRIAQAQKKLPLSESQLNEINKFLDNIKAKTEIVERKESNKATIWIVVTIVLIILRILLRLNR